MGNTGLSINNHISITREYHHTFNEINVNKIQEIRSAHPYSKKESLCLTVFMPGLT